MGTVASRRRGVTVVKSWDSLDASAEAEGRAISRLAAFTADDFPQSRRQAILGQIRAAMALGIPLNPKTPPYRKQCSMRAFARIAKADRHYLTWGPPESRRVPHANDDAYRARRAERFLRRAALILRLQRMSSRQVIGLSEAAAISGLGERTLQRAAVQGRLTATRVRESTSKNGTVVWRTTVGAVKDILVRKLKGQPIAA